MPPTTSQVRLLFKKRGSEGDSLHLLYNTHETSYIHDEELLIFATFSKIYSRATIVP